eukprot:2929429-Rhodomonas_salina.2
MEGHAWLANQASTRRGRGRWRVRSAWLAHTNSVPGAPNAWPARRIPTTMGLRSTLRVSRARKAAARTLRAPP